MHTQKKTIPLRRIPLCRDMAIGVWRSWLAFLVWDQAVLRSSRSTPTEKWPSGHFSVFRGPCPLIRFAHTSFRSLPPRPLRLSVFAVANTRPGRTADAVFSGHFSVFRGPCPLIRFALTPFRSLPPRPQDAPESPVRLSCISSASSPAGNGPRTGRCSDTTPYCAAGNIF